MSIEMHGLIVSDRIVVFVETQSDQRRDLIKRNLISKGARYIGPQSFMFQKKNFAPEVIRDAIGDLEEGECVYLLDVEDGVLKCYIVALSNKEQGIKIGPPLAENNTANLDIE